MHIEIKVTAPSGESKKFETKYDPSVSEVETPECGVYRLYDAEGKVIYIGASEDMGRRIRTHVSEKRIPFFDWSRILCRPEELEVIEKTLIRLYRPKFNKKQHNEH